MVGGVGRTGRFSPTGSWEDEEAVIMRWRDSSESARVEHPVAGVGSGSCRESGTFQMLAKIVAHRTAWAFMSRGEPGPLS